MSRWQLLGGWDQPIKLPINGRIRALDLESEKTLEDHLVKENFHAWKNYWNILGQSVHEVTAFDPVKVIVAQ